VSSISRPMHLAPLARHRSRRIVVGLIPVALVASLLAASGNPLSTSRASADGATSDQRPVVPAEQEPQTPDQLLAQGAQELQTARETLDPTAYARAEQSFRAVLAADSRNVAALVGLGSVLLSRHEFRQALSVGREALSLSPFTSSAYGVVGDALVELGRYDEAVVIVQRMVDLRPDLASYSRVSYIRELHGDLDGAVAAMRLAVGAAGPATENTEYVRVQLGNLEFARGHLEAAEQAYRQSLLRLPEYHLALAGLARVTAARGDLPSAIALFERATAKLPLPESIVGLGETLEAAGRSSEAADEYALAEAMQRLNAANGVQVDLELAAFFADHGDSGTAVRLARAAWVERPTVLAADVLAWSLYRDHQVERAGRWLRQSLRLGTDSSRLLYHAGMIEAALGATADARRHLSRALMLNPAFNPLDAPRARAALRALDG
jgi:tetratricopeptide (TPR) repeat protein